MRLEGSPLEVSVPHVRGPVKPTALASGCPAPNVRGTRPESVEYAGPAGALRDVWIALRASLRSVLESVSLADLAGGELPESVRALVADPDAWHPH